LEQSENLGVLLNTVHNRNEDVIVYSFDDIDFDSRLNSGRSLGNYTVYDAKTDRTGTIKRIIQKTKSRLGNCYPTSSISEIERRFDGDWVEEELKEYLATLPMEDNLTLGLGLKRYGDIWLDESCESFVIEKKNLSFFDRYLGFDKILIASIETKNYVAFATKWDKTGMVRDIIALFN
jgi:hypothetical protein